MVWLVRHGAAEVGPGQAIGVSDPVLSEVGRRQAQHLAGALAQRPVSRVISSDLARAAATAMAIAAPHGLLVEATTELREIDFGAWEERSLADLWTEAPEEARAWEADLRATPPSFGEGLVDLEKRVLGFWQRLGEGEASLAPTTRGRDVVIVGHRGSLVVLWAEIMKVPIERAWRWRCSPGTAVAVAC